MLDQACAHCPIFPTAASRRSLGRVSVPVWLIILSDQLPIGALVGLYPTNKLIGRRLFPGRLAPLDLSRHAVLATVSRGCPPPKDRYLRVTHPSATDSRSCPCDLHVLSMPPAFALSQDQTLRFISQPKLQHERTRTLWFVPGFLRRRTSKRNCLHQRRYATDALKPNHQVRVD